MYRTEIRQSFSSYSGFRPREPHRCCPYTSSVPGSDQSSMMPRHGSGRSISGYSTPWSCSTPGQPSSGHPRAWPHTMELSKKGVITTVLSLLYCCILKCHELKPTPLAISSVCDQFDACNLTLQCVYDAAMMYVSVHLPGIHSINILTRSVF